MYNGRFKSFTYGADGQLAINNEKQWGDSIVNNNAEHFSIQSKIKDLINVSSQAKKQSEFFQNQNENQAKQIDFLNAKYNVLNNISKKQENFYSNMIQEQYANFNQLASYQENLCNSTLNNQQNNLLQQQNLLQKQQNALEYFQNINEAQSRSNLNIQERHMDLSRQHPEHFTLENFADDNKCMNKEKYETTMNKCKWDTNKLPTPDYPNEQAVFDACNADNDCKGYATFNNKWYKYTPMDETKCDKGSEQSYCKRKA
jgi:hypothetical protein